MEFLRSTVEFDALEVKHSELHDRTKVQLRTRRWFTPLQIKGTALVANMIGWAVWPGL